MKRRDFNALLLGGLSAAALPDFRWPRGIGRAEPLRVNGERLNRQLTEISRFGANPQGGVTRLAYSDADKQAREYVLGRALVVFLPVRPFSPVNPRQLQLAKAMIEQIHGQFIAVVKEGRGDRLKEGPDTFSGLYWNGEEAVKLGLADAVGNLDFVAREVVKAEDIVDYTPHDNVAERLAKRFGASVGAGAVKAMRQLSPLR